MPTISTTWNPPWLLHKPRKNKNTNPTNSISPIQAILITNPTLAQDITSAISTYSTKPNKQNPSQHDPVELTDGF
jgi:hypothetical protein